jgi:hypothetical protein
VGEAGLLALVLGAKAELSIERGDPALADHELERAAAYAERSGDEVGRAEVQRVEAFSAIARGDWLQALDRANEAREVAVRHGSALLAAECAGIAARALRALERDDEAAGRQAEAEAGFRQLGATALLARLQQDLAD